MMQHETFANSEKNPIILPRWMFFYLLSKGDYLYINKKYQQTANRGVISFSVQYKQYNKTKYFVYDQNFLWEGEERQGWWIEDITEGKLRVSMWLKNIPIVSANTSIKTGNRLKNNMTSNDFNLANVS